MKKNLVLRILGYMLKERKKEFTYQIITYRKLHMAVNSTAYDNFSIKVNCSASQIPDKPIHKRPYSNCCIEMKLHAQLR